MSNHSTCNLEFVHQKPEILSMRSNEILTAVIHGARKDEPSSEVQLAAINALYNSLEFVRDNFEREVCGGFYYFCTLFTNCLTRDVG